MARSIVRSLMEPRNSMTMIASSGTFQTTPTAKGIPGRTTLGGPSLGGSSSGTSFGDS
jgi:hypothetical protein